MIKKTVTSIYIVCSALGGRAEDSLLPNFGVSLSTEPVTVELTLGIDDYNTLSIGRTCMEGMPPMLSIPSPDMDMGLMAVPSVIRATPFTVIIEDDAVYSHMGSQFDGTKPDGGLVEKKSFTSPDGSIRTDEVEVMPTPAGQKNMVVILINVNESESVAIAVGNSTYEDLQQSCMTLATDDGTFPRSKVTLPNGDGGKIGIVMCDQIAVGINAGKQLHVSLKCTVARVTSSIKAAYQYFIDVEHTWNATLMNIPIQSYYDIIGGKVIFPSESSIDKADFFWTELLKTITAANLVVNTDPIYIPINLQQVVSTSTQSIRRGSTPTGGIYLQVIGLGNTTVPGPGNSNVVRDFFVYQLFPGKNFTNDFSVSANYDLAYSITLKGNGLDDTNVIRLIPGYFSEELAAYDANGIVLSSINDVNAVKWKYSNKIELHFSDGYYLVGSSSGTITSGVEDLEWHVGTVLDERGVTSMTDGHKNTELLQATGVPWEKYAAVYTCYRGTNGYDRGVAAKDTLWYPPSISELIGTWISSSSTRKQLAGNYWSSTTDPNADKAFAVTNEGKVYSGTVGNMHAVRVSQDPGKAAHVGDVDK